jgi:hypothetical protein
LEAGGIGFGLTAGAPGLSLGKCCLDFGQAFALFILAGQ